MLASARKLISAALLLALLPAVLAADSDERFLTGLRERRLFGLAETYCLRRLDDARLSESQRAGLVVELSRCYTEHAQRSPPGASADGLWQQASLVPLEFARKFPNSPWLLLVKAQSALVVLARGELARQQSEVSADNQKQLDEARAYLRLAVRQLSDVSEELAARLRDTMRVSNAPGLSRDELLSLQRNLRYQQARAMRYLGQSFPPDSPDRTNSLTQAVEALAPLTQLSPVDPLCFQSRLDEIVCERLLKDIPAAHRRLGQLLQMDPPPAVALQARAEQIRLSLAVGNLEEALALLQAGREVEGQRSAELDLAWLETYLATWRTAIAAKDASQAKRWESQASATLGEIASRHGAYWTRRAESMLSGQMTSATPASDSDVLIRIAEGHFRNGQFDAAIKAYDGASAAAAEKGNPRQAFQFAFTAASIEHERKQYRAALVRYRNLALADPKQERAAEAHHLAIYNAAQDAKQSQSGTLAEYASLLQEHLQLWPTGANADQAHWLLGRLREHESDLPAAIAEYQRISPEHAQFLPGLQALSGCYQRWLEQLRAANQPTREAIAQGARHFEALFVSAEGRLPERWSPIERAAALSAARLWLQDSPPRYDRAEAMLTAALADGNADAAWKSAAAGILVSALAGQGRLDDARRKLTEVSGGSAADLLSLVEGLSQIAQNADPQARPHSSALLLHAASLLAARRNELDAPGQARLDRIQARALAAVGKAQEARQLYALLARQNPRDGDLQEEYALLLSEAQDKPALEEALSKWRELEQKSKPGSERWFRAKFQLALAHERLGNKQHAAKVITLTQVLHPDLGGAEMKARFLELLARCQQ